MQILSDTHINSTGDWFDLVGGDPKHKALNQRALAILQVRYPERVILSVSVDIQQQALRNGVISFTYRMKNQEELAADEERRRIEEQFRSSPQPFHPTTEH